MWIKKAFFERITAVILILFAIYLLYALTPILSAIMHFTTKILFPIFLSLIFYYLLRPLVQWLQKRIGIHSAITIAFLLTASVLFVLGIFIHPAIASQFQTTQSTHVDEVTGFKTKGNTLFDGLERLSENLGDEADKVISSMLASLHTFVINNIMVFIAVMTQFIFTLIVVPFLLFYLLKDGSKMHALLLRRIPHKYVNYVERTLMDCDQALLQFINGRVVIAAITATLLYCCFLFIGIEYIVILTLISFIFYIVPTIGPVLAMILPLIVGFSMNAMTGLKVLIIMPIISSIEGFLISTMVMGATLYIHPLTLLLILVAAGTFYGVFGLLFAAPAYIVGKIVFQHTVRFLHERKKRKKAHAVVRTTDGEPGQEPEDKLL